MKLAARSLVLSLSVLFCVHGHAAAGPAKLDIIPKCGLVGSWHGQATIPDGADGIPAALLLRFARKGREVSVRVAANDKPVAVQNAIASCFEFSFDVPQTGMPVEFSGKLSKDGLSVSGTARRGDLTTSWTLQRP